MSRTIEQPHCAVDASRATEPRAVSRVAEVRCECGSLMARLVGNHIELKCRRCKRVVAVAADRASRGWVPINGCGP